ncbi:DUF4262 domain-containing protein [Streptomyces sp. 184]|uniref:DUF4262 domain-containing protein n=1 Tax=Streptomyces sp. 184 TaxID=1827526 RepID=UPI003891AE89
MPADRGACHCVACKDIDEPDPRTQATMRTVERHGWQVVMVPTDDKGPGWAYTIGPWHRHRIPEPAVFGPDSHLTQNLLNGLGRRAVDGQSVAADQTQHDFTGATVTLKAIDYRWYKAYFGTAIRFYRKPPFPFLQVVRQAGGEDLRTVQPQLWLHPDAHPAGIWTQDL